MTGLLEMMERHPILSGWTGALTSLSSAAVISLDQVNDILKCVNGLVALGIGVLTIVAMVRKSRRSDRD